MDKFITRHRKRCHPPEDEETKKLRPRSTDKVQCEKKLMPTDQVPCEKKLRPTDQVPCEKKLMPTDQVPCEKKLRPTDQVPCEKKLRPTDQVPCGKKLRPTDQVPCEKKSSSDQEEHSTLIPSTLDLPNIKPTWKKFKSENLDLDYCILFNKLQSQRMFKLCEEELEYNTGKIAQVQIFGKWIDIPRKQVAFGDPGLSYSFSGNTVPARPWLPFLAQVKDYISGLTGHNFNFVLINRYKDGKEYMGEHKDDEKDLNKHSPIASLSLGQTRDFYFKHQDTRGKKATRDVAKVSMELSSGSLLLMNYPTNLYWYHALPKRMKVTGTSINSTFVV